MALSNILSTLKMKLFTISFTNSQVFSQISERLLTVLWELKQNYY